MIVEKSFFFSGNKIGILLIHGLTGTPTEMKLVGKGLHHAGFTVYGMQLAGHCGDVDDLIVTGWRDWRYSVIDAVEKLQQHVDHIFIGGLSMGALLALKYAIDFPSKVKGVLAYGPTFRYDGWSIPRYSKYVAPWFLPLMNYLKIGRRKMFVERPPYGILNPVLRQRIVRSMESGNSAEAGLIGNPWPSLSQLIALSSLVRQKLQTVVAPCLIIHADNDDIAHVRNAKLVQKKVSGPVELHLLKNSYHMITLDNDRQELIELTIRFIHRYFPDLSINCEPDLLQAHDTK